jgi:ABC-type branched-subunit amino acid transport system substrate-binding protein
LSPGALQAAPVRPPNTLRIGVLVPLTGPKADTGKAVLAGVELAAKVAAPKRVPGVKVEVIPLDTQCEDVPALRAAAKLARVNNVGEEAERCVVLLGRALWKRGKFAPTPQNTCPPSLPRNQQQNTHQTNIKNADAMIGDVCSGATLAATAVANKYQIPLVSPAASSTSLTRGDDYFFRCV